MSGNLGAIAGASWCNLGRCCCAYNDQYCHTQVAHAHIVSHNLRAESVVFMIDSAEHTDQCRMPRAL